jgi:hypothetical protein
VDDRHTLPYICVDTRKPSTEVADIVLPSVSMLLLAVIVFQDSRFRPC